MQTIVWATVMVLFQVPIGASGKRPLKTNLQFDIVVYGGTPAGVSAAVSAATVPKSSQKRAASNPSVSKLWIVNT